MPDAAITPSDIEYIKKHLSDVTERLDRQDEHMQTLIQQNQELSTVVYGPAMNRSLGLVEQTKLNTKIITDLVVSMKLIRFAWPTISAVVAIAMTAITWYFIQQTALQVIKHPSFQQAVREAVKDIQNPSSTPYRR